MTPWLGLQQNGLPFHGLMLHHPASRALNMDKRNGVFPFKDYDPGPNDPQFGRGPFPNDLIWHTLCKLEDPGNVGKMFIWVEPGRALEVRDETNWQVMFHPSIAKQVRRSYKCTYDYASLAPNEPLAAFTRRWYNQNLESAEARNACAQNIQVMAEFDWNSYFN